MMSIRQIITATALYAFLAVAGALPSVPAFANDGGVYEMGGPSELVPTSEDLGSPADETALQDDIKEVLETN